MFTGIIEKLGRISSLISFKGGKEITIGTTLGSELNVDDSIAVNGVCLTVVRQDDSSFSVQAVEETLAKTSIGRLQTKELVNLERCIRLDQRLDGHIVQGHVDTTGNITRFENKGAEWQLEVEFEPSFSDLIVPRGSISIDGISLTVAREFGHRFMVAVIPYTYENTNLNQRKVGDKVNLEFDIFGKYVLRYMKNREGKSGNLTESFLREHGFDR